MGGAGCVARAGAVGGPEKWTHPGPWWPSSEQVAARPGAAEGRAQTLSPLAMNSQLSTILKDDPHPYPFSNNNIDNMTTAPRASLIASMSAYCICAGYCGEQRAHDCGTVGIWGRIILLGRGLDCALWGISSTPPPTATTENVSRQAQCPLGVKSPMLRTIGNAAMNQTDRIHCSSLRSKHSPAGGEQ